MGYQVMPLESLQKVALGTLARGPFLSACSRPQVGSEQTPWGKPCLPGVVPSVATKLAGAQVCIW